MAHPFAAHRQQTVERDRVAKMTGGYAKGGHTDATQDRKMIKAMVKPGALSVEGKKGTGRLDKYARGGPVKKGGTNVNVIIAPQGGAAPPPMMPPPVLAGGPPPMPPPGPPGMPPMPQRRGGRAYASGGSVKEQSLTAGTQVQHTDGKNDGGDIYRGKQVTYATGGPVEVMGMGPKLTAGDNGEGRLQKAALQKRKR